MSCVSINLVDQSFFTLPPPSERLQQRIVSSLETMARKNQTPPEEIPQTDTEELIGYILPVNPNQTRHLMIFKDGTMLVTEPRSSTNEVAYIGNFSPNEAPMTFGRTWTLPQVIMILSDASPWGSRTLWRNDNPSDVAQIDTAREQAIQVAQVLKEQRIRAKEETSRRLVDNLKNFLFPPKPPQPDQPQ